MPQVHSSAIIQGDVQIGEGCIVGPHCVLDGTNGRIVLGRDCRLIGGVYLTGPLELGAGNMLYPGACLGFPPQDLKWDPAVAGAGLRVGDGNTFRENATIHRATSHETPTIIGHHNYWMAGSHAGHDCRVGDHCIFANGALLAGFVRIDDRVIMGGNASVHQFCRVGRGAMLSGSVGMTQDLPPWFMLTAINVAGSINLIGLRRSGTPPEQIDDVRWVYKTLYRREMSPRKALETLRERADSPMVRQYIEFIEQSQRGICSPRGRAARSC